MLFYSEMLIKLLTLSAACLLMNYGQCLYIQTICWIYYLILLASLKYIQSIILITETSWQRLLKDLCVCCNHHKSWGPQGSQCELWKLRPNKQLWLKCLLGLCIYERKTLSKGSPGCVQHGCPWLCLPLFLCHIAIVTLIFTLTLGYIR